MVRNLLIHLRAQGEEALRQIADRWEIALTGRSTADTVAQLYRTMRDPWMVRERAAAFSSETWLLIEALLAVDAVEGRALAQLAVQLGRSEQDVAATLSELAASGIVAAEDAQFALPRELATAFRRIQEERLLAPTLSPATPLRALLTTLEGAELEEAAELWGVRATPGTIRRDDLIDEILARVDLPEQRRAITRDLPPEAAQVLKVIRAAGGQAPVSTLAHQLQLTPPVLREAMRLLQRRLLVWPVWGEPVSGADRATLALLTPQDLVKPRRPPRDAPPPLAPVTATPQLTPTYPFSAAWDLLTVLQRLERRTLEWREGDEERNATAVRRLASALWGTTTDGRVRPGYLPLLLTLAQELGLVRVEEERYELVGAALEPWRGQSFASEAQALFARWTTTTDWPEEASQDDLQLVNVDWPAARSLILEELRACPVHEWYDLELLALRIARLRPELLGGSFHAARASGPAGTREEVTAAVVEVALLGALVPLGVLSLGEHHAGKRQLPAVAVTAVGAWLLGTGPEPAVPRLADRPLTVGADFEIVLFHPVPRRVWALGAIADLVRLDTAAVYRLTASSVRRGIVSGLSPEQVVGLLERGGRAPLPQNVAFTLREWTEGYAGVRLARALLLKPDDSTMVDRLLAALHRANLPPPEQLSDGRLLLTLAVDGEAAPVLAALREAGFTPHWLRALLARG